jgi:PHD/YefM family antitoxin component YafN of YafNO toxin-antitoxin module
MANNPTVTEKAYNRLRQQTAKQLGESVNSDRVKLVVMLRLQQEAILIRQLRGEHVATAETVTLNEAISSHLPRAKPIGVDLHIVETADTVACPQCSHEFQPDKVRRTLEEAQHAARERMAKESAARAANAVVPQPAETPRSVTDVVPGAGKISTGRTPPPNVVELKRPSIHDPVVFGDGTKLNPPLKRPEAWQGYPLPTV